MATATKNKFRSPANMLSWQWRSMIEELQELQRHLSDPSCPCILADSGEFCGPKHALGLHTLAKETVAMAPEHAKMLEQLAEEALAQHIALKDRIVCSKPHRDEKDTVEWSRQWRKRIEPIYYACSLKAHLKQERHIRAYKEGDTPKTGEPISITYQKNLAKAPSLGKAYGQHIEPTGEYMAYHDVTLGSVREGWLSGTITFRNPLVLEYKSTGVGGWKTDLSKMFGGKTGRVLTSAIIAAGYDGIITIEEFRGKTITSEIVNINGEKGTLGVLSGVKPPAHCYDAAQKPQVQVSGQCASVKSDAPLSPVEGSLLNSIMEEHVAVQSYIQRGGEAARAGDMATANLYKHVAAEEGKHYDEFSARLAAKDVTKMGQSATMCRAGGIPKIDSIIRVIERELGLGSVEDTDKAISTRAKELWRLSLNEVGTLQGKAMSRELDRTDRVRRVVYEALGKALPAWAAQEKSAKMEICPACLLLANEGKGHPSPAPWHANTVVPESENLKGVDIMAHDGTHVAVAYGSANAKLLAAAPELRGSLGETLEELETAREGDTWPTGASAVKHRAEAALDKAKGHDAHMHSSTIKDWSKLRDWEVDRLADRGYPEAVEEQKRRKRPVCTPSQAKKREQCIQDVKAANRERGCKPEGNGSKKCPNPFSVCTSSIGCRLGIKSEARA
jgi:hypothetical protein